jgi:Transposase DDE domain group 1
MILFLLEGMSHAWVRADLRPGARPTGAEHAMILARLLPSLRPRWPYTPILIRGDSHGAPPEGMDVLAHRRLPDFVCGCAGKAVLLRQAEPVRQEARRLPKPRTALAPTYGQRLPARSRLSEECC